MADGPAITKALANLLGRDVPASVSEWLGKTDATLETIADSDDANDLSDAELYEIATQLLTHSETLDDLNEVKQYEDIANAIFAAISSDEEGDVAADVEDNDDGTSKIPDQLQKFLDLKTALKEDSGEDSEVGELGDDSATVIDFLGEDDATDLESAKTALPVGFAGLSPEEQVAIIEYYKANTMPNLADAAIKAVPTEAFDDVMAALHESDPADAKAALTTRFTDATEANVAADIKALLSSDGSFSDMDSSDKAALVGNLIETLQDAAVTESIVASADTPPLANVLIQALQANTDFKSDINASDSTDKSFGALKKLLNTPTDDNTVVSFQDITDTTALTDALDDVLNSEDSTGKTAATTLKDTIVDGRGDPDPDNGDRVGVLALDALLKVYDITAPDPNSIPVLQDLIYEILTNNTNLTDEEYKKVLASILMASPQDVFQAVLKDAQDNVPDTTRLPKGYYDSNAFKDYNTIPLETGEFSVPQDALERVYTDLEAAEDDAKLAALKERQTDTLLLALQDTSLDKDLLLSALADKALDDETGATLRTFHMQLQFLPDLLDNLETMAENNPDNKVLNFLTSSYAPRGTAADADKPYVDLVDTLKGEKEDFKTILFDALGDSLDEDYKKSTALSTEEATLLSALETAETADDDEADDAVADAKDKAFEAYVGTDPDSKFAALTDMNSDLYEAAADKEELLQDTLDWLVNYGTTAQQEAFLKSIEPSSELYFALTQLATDLLEGDEESELGLALKDITTAIGEKKEGETVDFESNDIEALFDKDEDENISTEGSEIFGYIQTYQDNGILPLSVRGFVEIINNTDITTDEDREKAIQDFLKTLSTTEAEKFFTAVLQDDSVLSLLGKDLSPVFKSLITVMGEKGVYNSADGTDYETQNEELRLTFLKSIPSDGDLFTALEDAELDQDILDAIDGEDFDDIDDTEIKEFFDGDLSDVITSWNGNTAIDGYLADLDGLSDTKEIAKVLDTAKDAGNIQPLLSKLFAGDSEYFDQDIMLGVFDWLSDNDDEADTFFENLLANSDFNKALKILIEDEIEPFDKLSIDTTTEKLKVSDNGNLVKMLKENDDDALDTLLDQIAIEQEDNESLDESAGADNSDLKDLTDAAAAAGEDGDIVDFETYFANKSTDDDPDYDDADALIEDIMTDDNYLFKSLTQKQLQNFAEQFIKYIKTAPDELKETFGEALDADNTFGKALIAAGATKDDIDDASDVSDYKNILNDANDYEAFATSVSNTSNYNEYLEDGGDILSYMSDELRGLDKKDEIQTAVDKILDFAFKDDIDIEKLIQDILSGTGEFSQLTEDQADALLDSLFQKIKDEEPEDDDEDLSNAQKIFLDSLVDSAFYTDDIFTENAYEDIQAYLKGTLDDDKEDDVAKDLKKLLGDNDFIKNITENNAGNDLDDNDDDSDVDSNELEVDDSVISSVDDSSNYTDDTVKNGYSAIIKLFDRDAIEGEQGQLSEGFFRTSGQSASDIGKKAAEETLSFNEVSGLISIMKPQEGIDFIEAFLSSGGGDSTTIGLLLMQLMIYQVDGDISNSAFETVINKIDQSNNAAVTSFLSGYSVKDLIDKSDVRQGVANFWKANVSGITNLSATEIDNTISDITNWVKDDSVTLPTPPVVVNPQPPQPPYPITPYGGFSNFGAAPNAFNSSFGMYGSGGSMPAAGMMGMPQMPGYPSAEVLYMRGMIQGLLAAGGSGGNPMNQSVMPQQQMMTQPLVLMPLPQTTTPQTTTTLNIQ